MVIRVNPSKAVSAAISYLEPKFTASWLEVQVDAACSIPDVYQVDVVTPTDLLTKATTKFLTDQTTRFAEQVNKEVGKAAADTQELADEFERTVAKSVTDTQALLDATITTLAKLLVDAALSTDSSSYSLGKTLADSLAEPTDFLSAEAEKGITDSASLSESLVATLIFIRSLSDSLSSSDLPLLETLIPKSDIITVDESIDFSVGFGINDGINLIDNMDGDIEYNIIKLVGELLFSADGQAIDFARQSLDNVLTSSGGVLSMQDYCDITYFLEDYVGTSRTFT